jgi:hypothetical protein
LCSAPFASDEAHADLAPVAPTAHTPSASDAEFAACKRRSGKQEIISKTHESEAPAEAAGVELSKSAAQVAREEAAAAQQREEEEWAAAKRIIDEDEAAERRQEEQRRKRKQAASEAASEAAAKSCAASAPLPAVSEDGAEGFALFPDRLSAEELERMSKKELVVVLQKIAAPEALQAVQLSGNPVNVAKKASKEKVRAVVGGAAGQVCAMRLTQSVRERERARERLRLRLRARD